MQDESSLTETDPGAVTPAPEEESAEPTEEPGSDAANPANPEGDGAPEPSDPAAVDPEAPAEGDPAPEALEGDSEALTETPESLPVSGIVVVVAGETEQLTSPLALAETGGVAVPEESEAPSDRVLVATDAGPLVRIDPALAGAEPEPGARFEGVLTLDETARAAVQDEIAEDGAIAIADALEVATADAPELPAPVAGAVVSNAAVGGAPATKSHPVDLVFFTGGGNPSDADLQNLVKHSSTYWKGQTNGALSALSINYKKRMAPAGNSKALRCDPNYTQNLWNQAAKAFGRSSQSYYTSGRHLVVVVDDNCGSYSGGVAGWGSYGKSLHSGGMVWVDIGQRGGGSVSKANGLVAHEIGHNLSLGHGNTRVCTGPGTDSKQSSAGRPASPCWDIEYGDMYSIMGYGSNAGTATTAGVKPTALPISQKSMLGVAPAGSVKTVKAAGGRSQTFTLQPGGGSSGLRGLKVESPTGGTYFVEYRNKSGQDSGMALSANNWLYLDSGSQRTFAQYQGVRVMRTHTQAYNSFQNIRTSTAISVRDTLGGRAGLNQTMRAGKSSTPWNTTARVTVVSTGATAKVRVDFTPFIDVPYAHKFAKEINWMSSAKLSTGINAGSGLRKYAPKNNVTREAMAAFLYRLEAPKNYKAPKKSPFKDVKTNHKFYKEIAWMYTSGLSTGIKVSGGRNYAPKASVTREAMAAFIYRLEKSTYKGAAKSPFADVKKGQKFYKEVTWMYSSGLSTGINKNGKRTYAPKGNVTREAMAAFIYRLEH
ncbi:S-layer homology domain-containing protein [Leucobacter luti]|uniref:S-layer homology domain-containing protein n=1 Tax=Leucobacter luti TaxID=340320 RepID=UPI00104DA376|nr:S-layer homology domain-containing protein [Leucobacter luti]MCW2289874.1 hypothetical protein [Leucobacter luti]